MRKKYLCNIAITGVFVIAIVAIFLLLYQTSKEEVKCQAGIITITELRKELEKKQEFYLNDGGEYQIKFAPNGCAKVIKSNGRR